MSRAKRYSNEPKLNIKKVIAVILAIIVIIMFIFAIKTLLSNSKKQGKVTATSYYPVYTNEKWGVINSLGEVVIEPTYNEAIIIPNNKEEIFIITYDVDYTNNTYKTKVVNSKGKEQFTNYNQVQAIENYDESNNIWYEEGVLKVQKEGKYGLINFKGKEILAPQYDEITSIKGIENSLIIKKDNKLGLCNNEGKVIIEPKYNEIKALTKDYKQGYIVTNAEQKQGIISFDKKQILEEKYEEIKQVANNSMYVVKEAGNLKLIDETGLTILENKFDNVEEINTNQIIFIRNNLKGIMNLEGTELVPAQYQELKYTTLEYYIAKKDDKYGIINDKNEEKVPFQYSNINYQKGAKFFQLDTQDQVETKIINNKLEEKLIGIISEINTKKEYIRIRIGQEYKYYNFKFEEKQAKDILTGNTLFLSKKDGKYGYVDKDNQEIVPHQFDDATEQNEYGFMAVKRDGKWGALNKEGVEVITPKYNLEQNLIIDFIGKWHYGVDTNLNYYTDN